MRQKTSSSSWLKLAVQQSLSKLACSVTTVEAVQRLVVFPPAFCGFTQEFFSQLVHTDVALFMPLTGAKDCPRRAVFRETTLGSTDDILVH